MSHLAGHTARPPLEAMIVMGAVGLGCAYATYVGTRTLTRHNDVVINRSKGPFGFMTESSETVIPRNYALNTWKNRLSIANDDDDNKA